MKVIINTKTKEYISNIDENGEFYTGDLPKLFPDTSSLEEIKNYYKHLIDEDIDISPYEMYSVIIQPIP